MAAATDKYAKILRKKRTKNDPFFDKNLKTDYFFNETEFELLNFIN